METAGAELWDELNMTAVNGQLERMFPEICFDGDAVLQLLLKGDIWHAVCELG